MGCGKYGGTTYQPSFELGALFVFVLHKHVIFDMGLHMITSIGLQETDKHAFRPAPLAIHVDTGLLFRW